MNFYVEIVKRGKPEEIVKKLGPMSEWKADKVCDGADRNLNHKEYFTRICCAPGVTMEERKALLE